MTDYTHRDLCSATAGILNAYLDISERRDDLDRETVEAIVESYNNKHDEFGAETPKPEKKP